MRGLDHHESSRHSPDRGFPSMLSRPAQFSSLSSSSFNDNNGSHPRDSASMFTFPPPSASSSSPSPATAGRNPTARSSASSASKPNPSTLAWSGYRSPIAVPRSSFQNTSTSSATAATTASSTSARTSLISKLHHKSLMNELYDGSDEDSNALPLSHASFMNRSSSSHNHPTFNTHQNRHYHRFSSPDADNFPKMADFTDYQQHGSLDMNAFHNGVPACESEVFPRLQRDERGSVCDKLQENVNFTSKRWSPWLTQAQLSSLLDTASKGEVEQLSANSIALDLANSPTPNPETQANGAQEIRSHPPQSQHTRSQSLHPVSYSYPTQFPSLSTSNSASASSLASMLSATSTSDSPSQIEGAVNLTPAPAAPQHFNRFPHSRGYHHYHQSLPVNLIAARQLNDPDCETEDPRYPVASANTASTASAAAKAARHTSVASNHSLDSSGSFPFPAEPDLEFDDASRSDFTASSQSKNTNSMRHSAHLSTDAYDPALLFPDDYESTISTTVGSPPYTSFPMQMQKESESYHPARSQRASISFAHTPASSSSSSTSQSLGKGFHYGNGLGQGPLPHSHSHGPIHGHGYSKSMSATAPTTIPSRRNASGGFFSDYGDKAGPGYGSTPNSFLPANKGLPASNNSRFSWNGYPANPGSVSPLLSPSGVFTAVEEDIMPNESEDMLEKELSYNLGSLSLSPERHQQQQMLGNGRAGVNVNSMPPFAYPRQQPRPPLSTPLQSHPPVGPQVPVTAASTANSSGQSYQRLANVPLTHYIGNIYPLSKDQHGCRYLQRQLETRNPDSIHHIFAETHVHIVELMTDPFGNYLCQKLLEHASVKQQTDMMRCASPALVHVALNQHGTRALQKMIEFVKTEEQVHIVIHALSSDVVRLVKDLNGNHVIQKCLNHLRSEDAQFIYNSVSEACVEVGTHRHGCCVLQRCIDHASGTQKRQLIVHITKHAFALVQDPFGNYVVQYILDLQEPAFIAPICRAFKGHVIQLSKQKFSSNVVEKCLRTSAMTTATTMPIARDDMYDGTDAPTTATSASMELVEEMLVPGTMELLLRDQYANYVVQTALEYAGDEGLRQRIIERIKPVLPAIRNMPHGRRIAGKMTGLGDVDGGIGTGNGNGNGNAAGNKTRLPGDGAGGGHSAPSALVNDNSNNVESAVPRVSGSTSSTIVGTAAEWTGPVSSSQSSTSASASTASASTSISASQSASNTTSRRSSPVSFISHGRNFMDGGNNRQQHHRVPGGLAMGFSGGNANYSTANTTIGNTAKAPATSLPFQPQKFAQMGVGGPAVSLPPHQPNHHHHHHSRHSLHAHSLRNLSPLQAPTPELFGVPTSFNIYGAAQHPAMNTGLSNEQPYTTSSGGGHVQVPMQGANGVNCLPGPEAEFLMTR